MSKSSFLLDFKAFVMRGNVVDMAVGVIIGGAFGKIISSVVADIIMPPIGLLVGGTNFSELRWELEPARVVDGVEQAAVTINYGNFIQTMLDFVIIAFANFLVHPPALQSQAQKRRDTLAPTCPEQRGKVTFRHT